MKKDKIKKILKMAVPKSRSYYVLITLNVIVIVFSLSTGNYGNLVWIILATLWMTLFYSTSDMLKDVFKMLDRSTEAYKNNLEQMDKLLSFLEKRGVVNKSPKAKEKIMN